MLCILLENRGIDLTYAYKNTIINYQENPHRTHCFPSISTIDVMVITYDTHSLFSNSFMCVSFTLLGGHFWYNSNLSISPPILGASLMITSWRHDLSCDDPSAWRYGEPLSYTKILAFRFLPECIRRILVSFM